MYTCLVSSLILCSLEFKDSTTDVCGQFLLQKRIVGCDLFIVNLKALKVAHVLKEKSPEDEVFSESLLNIN